MSRIATETTPAHYEGGPWLLIVDHGKRVETHATFELATTAAELLWAKEFQASVVKISEIYDAMLDYHPDRRRAM